MKVRRQIQPSAQRASRSGTVLIFALIVLAVAAVGMAGWVYLMGTLAEYAISANQAMARRLNLENSRALAFQYLREQVIEGGSTVAVSGTFTWGAYELGSLSIAAAADPPLTATDQPSWGNPFSPGGYTEYTQSGSTYYFRGYSNTLAGTLGVDEVAWAFEARSRTPTFGFDALALNTGGSAGGNFGGGTGSSAVAVEVFSGSGPVVDGVLLNTALPPAIWDRDFIDAAGSEVIDVTAVIADDAGQTVDYTCDGAGNVTIFLKRNSPQKKYYITGNLESLTFSNDAVDPGVDVSDWSPIRVICETTGLETVNFPNGSNRRLYLGIDNSNAAVTFNAGGTSLLRLAGFLQNTPVGFALAGSLTIEGGLQTDSGITFTGGTATFQREADPHGQLERLGCRRGWVEAYRQ